MFQAKQTFLSVHIFLGIIHELRSHILRHFQPSPLPFLLIFSTEKKQKLPLFWSPSPSISFDHIIYGWSLIIYSRSKLWRTLWMFLLGTLWGVSRPICCVGYYLFMNLGYTSMMSRLLPSFLIKTLSKPGLAAHLDNPFA